MIDSLRYVHLISFFPTLVVLDFINQFCDAVCVLDCSTSIQSLFSVDRRKVHAVCHILAILSHVLRTRSENVSVVQDILTKKGECLASSTSWPHLNVSPSILSLLSTDTDLLRLLSNRNPLIRSRCCTLLGYLTLRCVLIS